MIANYSKQSLLDSTYLQRLFVNDFNFIKDNTENFPKKYYYRIINEWNNNYVLTDVDDALVILLNCIIYNSPRLLLKLYPQLSIFLANNNNKSFLDKLFKNHFTDIYSLPILFLFYNLDYSDYYYKYANQLYEIFNIPISIQINPTTYILNYNIIQSNICIEDNKYLYYQEYDQEITYSTIESSINYYNHHIIYHEFKKTIYDDILQKNINKLIEPQPESVYIKIRVEGQQPVNARGIRHIRYNNYTDKNYKYLFKKLLQIFIDSNKFNSDQFDLNINNSIELFNYLIMPNKQILYPIQELIMGSGKTSTITPYICILLLNHFLKHKEYNKKIFIVMPNFLINQSFVSLMSYLFPLINNIEILINLTQYKYDNSLKIYLTSDTEYKKLFLTDPSITLNSYMIYDEVDMMANPITCELNIPNEISTLDNIDILYNIADIIYNDIFKNDKFWINIKNKNNNKIHNYIFDFDETIENESIKIYVNKFYDIVISAKIDLTYKRLIDYVKENILFFILTKQYNYDYGLPETYNMQVDYYYKFKAIPYSAIDSPSIGSEFSDPILTYILTFFCYKLFNNIYRQIDKDEFAEHFENKYKIDKDKYLKKIANLYNIPLLDFDKYIKYKKHYRNNYKKQLDDEYLMNIIKIILNRNTSFYMSCNNISFTDLLLYKNVNNFICYTGTAYIQLPVSTNINFGKNPINFNLIKNKTINEITKDIIETRVTNYYINDNIEDIFNHLYLYDVLIDIGGIFISYNIPDFIDKYSKLPFHRQFIVYFDDGMKIYNILTSKLINNTDILTDTNVFYYFSNKNITGVDAKKIMKLNAHGLVTITNKTNFRDFSQGIFRMRNIQDSQTIDIIFNDKLKNIILKGGGIKQLTDKHNLICKLIISLEKQQQLIDNQKYKLLLKQNIFALTKENTTKSKQILYIDPSIPHYNVKNIIFEMYINKNKYKDVVFNIDSINLINILNKYEDKIIEDDQYCLINDLKNKYFEFGQTYLINVKQNEIIMNQENEQKEQVEQKEQEEQEEQIKQGKQVEQYVSIIFNKSVYYLNDKIYYNFRYENNDCNQTLAIYFFDMYHSNYKIIENINVSLL
jgi:hypothetical protein